MLRLLQMRRQRVLLLRERRSLPVVLRVQGVVRVRGVLGMGMRVQRRLRLQEWRMKPRRAAGRIELQRVLQGLPVQPQVADARRPLPLAVAHVVQRGVGVQTAGEGVRGPGAMRMGRLVLGAKQVRAGTAAPPAAAATVAVAVVIVVAAQVAVAPGVAAAAVAAAADGVGGVAVVLAPRIGGEFPLQGGRMGGRLLQGWGQEVYFRLGSLLLYRAIGRRGRIGIRPPGRRPGLLRLRRLRLRMRLVWLWLL